MSLRDFIRENRREIKDRIGRYLTHVPQSASCSCYRSGSTHYHETPTLTDRDLEQWILNDEGLYNWARSGGVRI